MTNGGPVVNVMAHARFQRALDALLAGMEGKTDAQLIDMAIVFRRRWGLPCPEVDRDYYLIGLHRQRYHNARVKPELRGYSGQWLYERGLSLNRDQVYAPQAKKASR